MRMSLTHHAGGRQANRGFTAISAQKRLGVPVAPAGARMQRSVEVLIGRLITDEEFRRAFQRDPRGTLNTAAEWGLELTGCELQALMAADHTLWDRFAEEIDARLQKASLKQERRGEE
jgi:hypothetical protein